MRDVRGYEERTARVRGALKSGYPRFVVHEFIVQLIEFYLQRAGLTGQAGVLIPGWRATQDLLDWVGAEVSVVAVEGSVDSGAEPWPSNSDWGNPASAKAEGVLCLVHYAVGDINLNQRVRKFVQHTGCGVSSRQAEDLLLAYGLLEAAYSETSREADAESVVLERLGQQIGCAVRDTQICASGMNAFYAGFRAVQQAQLPQGRTKWLQLGWLYLDSGHILKEFLGAEESLEYCYDATDTAQIIKQIEAAGDTLACVVVECPTNPIMQVADLVCIAACVRRCGGMVMIDPTIASIYNVDVFAHADIMVMSLTKYIACAGDVMMGAMALNVASPHYDALVPRFTHYHQAPYVRDIARLAYEMERAPAVAVRINGNAQQLVDFLEEHPAVKKVHYAGHAEHFAAVARCDHAGGAMITVELRGALEPFYDALHVMKGPSFGTEFTLVCPFMHLAHYELVTAEEGRRFLRSIGIEPDLVRISVGIEPIGEIIESFGRALAISGGATSKS